MLSKIKLGLKQSNYRKIGAGLLTGSMLLNLGGCSSIGTNTLRHDRFDYNMALADSWKEQLLLNIVKVRYGDTPMFLDVAQIISAYTLTSGLSVNYLNAQSNNTTNGVTNGLTSAASQTDTTNVLTSALTSATANTITNAASTAATKVLGFTETFGIGGKIDFSDKPTVILKPQTDAQFIKALMTPLSPASVMFLLQAGYPAESVFGTTVESINEAKNWSHLGAHKRPADPKFLQIIKLISKAQEEGAIDISINKTPKGEVPIISFRKANPVAQELSGVTELRKLLNLAEDATEYTVGYGILQDAKEPISLQTRSVFRIMLDLSASVEVPKKDLAEKRAAPATQVAGASTPLRIHSGDMIPWNDAFTSVEYHGHWFWVDDRDMASKRTFNLLMLFFSLANQGSKGGDPIVTIPSGGSN